MLVGNVMAHTRIKQRSHGVMLAVMLAAGALTYGTEAGAELELIDSRVVTSVTGIWIDDDENRFSRRHGVADDDLIGGIEELRMEWWGDEGESVSLEGRAVVDNNDYLLKLGFDMPEKGFVSAGYREFRTYYDGSGGFFLRPVRSSIFSTKASNWIVATTGSRAAYAFPISPM